MTGNVIANSNELQKAAEIEQRLARFENRHACVSFLPFAQKAPQKQKRADRFAHSPAKKQNSQVRWVNRVEPSDK